MCRLNVPCFSAEPLTTLSAFGTPWPGLGREAMSAYESTWCRVEFLNVRHRRLCWSRRSFKIYSGHNICDRKQFGVSITAKCIRDITHNNVSTPTPAGFPVPPVSAPHGEIPTAKSELLLLDKAGRRWSPSTKELVWRIQDSIASVACYYADRLWGDDPLHQDTSSLLILSDGFVDMATGFLVNDGSTKKRTSRLFYELDEAQQQKHNAVQQAVAYLGRTAPGFPCRIKIGDFSTGNVR